MKPITSDSLFTFLHPDDLDRIDIDEVMRVALDSIRTGYYESFVNACIHENNSINKTYIDAIDGIKELMTDYDHVVYNANIYKLAYKILDKALTWRAVDAKKYEDVLYSILDISDRLSSRHVGDLYTDISELPETVKEFVAHLRGELPGRYVVSVDDVYSYYLETLSIEECTKIAEEINARNP